MQNLRSSQNIITRRGNRFKKNIRKNDKPTVTQYYIIILENTLFGVSHIHPNITSTSQDTPQSLLSESLFVALSHSA